MKKTILLFLLILVSVDSISQQLAPQLNKNGSYSLVKFGTSIKIDENQYEQIEPLGNNFFKIKLNGLWGVRNASKNLTPIEYNLIQKKSEGYIIANKLNIQEDPMREFYDRYSTHILDTLGNVVYEINYVNKVTDFINGVIEVTSIELRDENEIRLFSFDENNYGTIDKLSKNVFRDGKNKYLIYQNDHCCDISFKIDNPDIKITEENYDFDKIFDLKGNVLLKYPLISGVVSDGLFSVSNDLNYFGCVSIKNDTIIPFEYNRIGVFKNGMSIATRGVYNSSSESTEEKYGMINLEGKIIIPFDNHILELNEFNEGFSYKSLSGRDGYSGLFFNEFGKVVFKVPYDKKIIHKKFNNKLIGFEENISKKLDEIIKVGYYDNNFNVKIYPKYDYGEEFNDGYAKVKIKDKVGIINNSGVEVLPVKYDVIYYRVYDIYNHTEFADYITYDTEYFEDKPNIIFFENIALVKREEKIFYVDNNGFEYIEK